MRRFEEQAPAKLNLCLRITGRRPDGYHELDSCVVFTEWADRLTIVPDDRLTLELTGPFAPALVDASRQSGDPGGAAAGGARRPDAAAAG